MLRILFKSPLAVSRRRFWRSLVVRFQDIYCAPNLINGSYSCSGFAKFLDAIANLFKRKRAKAPLKTVYRKENRGRIKQKITIRKAANVK